MKLYQQYTSTLERTRLVFGLLFFVMLCFVSCTEDDSDKLMGEIGEGNTVDVSSRITGFEPNVTGAGAMLTALGSNLASVKRVIMEGENSPSVEATDDMVLFRVPLNAVIGTNEVVFVFAGNERATASIEVVALPIVSSVSPVAGKTGDEMVMIGNNFDIVEKLHIGGVEATITDTQKDILTFTVPAGAVSGNVFTVESPAGIVDSKEEFISCDSDPDNLLCLPVINGNGSFEEGDQGVVGDITVPSWGFSGAGTNANFEVVDFRAGEVSNLRQALKVEILQLGANPWNIEVREETFEAKPNTLYYYSIDVFGEEGARGNFTVGLPNFSELARSEVTLIQGWQTIYIEFSTGPDDNMIRTPIHFSIDGNVGRTFYLDNLRIVELDGTPCTFEADPECYCAENPDDVRCNPPLNSNGGFEAGDAGEVGTNMGQVEVPDWSFSGLGQNARIEVVEGSAYQGDQHLLVEVLELGANPWNIELLQQGITVTPNTTYVYSIWVKGTGGEAHFTVGNPSFNEFGRENFTSFTNDWQEITYEFTTGEDDVELRTPIHLSIDGNVGNIFQFDELSVKLKQ